MKFVYAKKFVKKFAKYNPAIQKQIYQAIDSIPSGDIKSIISKHTPKLYRLRVAKYRVIFYYTDKDSIRFLVMGSRNEVYKNIIK